MVNPKYLGAYVPTNESASNTFVGSYLCYGKSNYYYLSGLGFRRLWATDHIAELSEHLASNRCKRIAPVELVKW